ncbi:MAG TPA: response regulator transcription factor [Symbiobacteriaceae bacterium]|nr:response regulator transcription factor [Symbiobacteriaceae bacterium]
MISIFSNRRELVAHMEAALQQRAPLKPARPVQVGGLLICCTRRAASWHGKTLPLSPKEFDILAVLAEHCGQSVSRRALFGEVWGPDVPCDERLIDRHIMKLRRKMEDGADLIETVWGMGYRLANAPKKTAVKPKVPKRRGPA